MLLITETENPNQTAATHDLLNNDIKPVEIPKSLSAGIGAPLKPLVPSAPKSVTSDAGSDDIEFISEVPGSKPKPAQGLGSGKPAAYAQGKESNSLE